VIASENPMRKTTPALPPKPAALQEHNAPPGARTPKSPAADSLAAGLTMSDTKPNSQDADSREGTPAVGWNGTEFVGGADPKGTAALAVQFDPTLYDWGPNVRFVRVDPPKEGA
jgi:hypothetical protein